MVYLISGLGADGRVFNFLSLPQINARPIFWEKPEKNEPISQYCKKLLKQIDLYHEIILIGVSFGGIVAQEIAKLITVQKVIIISSVKSPEEFSFPLKFVRATQIHRIVPTWFLRFSNRLSANYCFGIESKAEAILLRQIIDDTDQDFLVWAIDQIVNWKNEVPKPLIHIHGTSDKIFPIRFIATCHEIPNGGHFMIVSKANEVSALIFDVLNKN